MAIPRRRRHLFTGRGPKKARKPRKPRRPRKARPKKDAVPAGKEPPEGCEAVKHYGDAWDFENYEKESHRARGLFL